MDHDDPKRSTVKVLLGETLVGSAANHYCSLSNMTGSVLWCSCSLPDVPHVLLSLFLDTIPRLLENGGYTS